ncbi:MAG TPA: hypothetical protein VGB83_12710 [Actinomycetota bacterium]
MLLAAIRARLSSRVTPAGLALAVAAAMFTPTAAQAGSGVTADPGLTGQGIGFGGTGKTVRSVRTQELRDRAATGAARILVIGTGIQKDLFPITLQPSIVTPSTADATDTHGYGTVAASAILQLLPDATITSVRVPPRDGAWNILDLPALAEALESARAQSGSYDAVLLAYPPQAALDPITHLIGHEIDKGLGSGWELVADAMMSAHARSGVTGIPTSKDLRSRVFEGVSPLQRDAVEKFTARAKDWQAILDAAKALDDAGVAVVSPSGDFTRTEGGALKALQTQTVFGLAALPSVITVGAAYEDGAVERTSPTSGRGPTLDLAPKPDLLGPSDMMVMLPKKASLPWPDDSLRVPLQTIDWAKQGVVPTPCPSATDTYRCALQGSSMTAASVVAANIAASVASGLPATAASRSGNHDEVLRGFAWAEASIAKARAFDTDTPAPVWEQGAGVFHGLRLFDPSLAPVPLSNAALGEAGTATAAKRTVPLWSGGANGAGSAIVESFIGPDPTGAAVATDYLDAERVSVTGDGSGVIVRAASGRYQGGVYGGLLTLSGAGGSVDVPLSLTQTLPFDFKTTYAYNELMTGGMEGERAENMTLFLVPNLPSGIGLIGQAFKFLSWRGFKNVGGDPSNSYALRAGVTQSSFDGSVPASQHGRGRIPMVSPGYYRMQVLADHGLGATQARGRQEELGIHLGTFGNEMGYAPGSDVFVSALPACGEGPFTGPFEDGCLTRQDVGSVDNDTGMCAVSNQSTGVSFNLYCGEVSYAIPSTVVSRAVHLIEHDPVPAASEWKTCGVGVPTDGSMLSFEQIAAANSDCTTTTTGSSAWSFPTGAPSCLPTDERASSPKGNASDITAVYRGITAGGVGQSLPVAVMTYEFPLPERNTYTVATLSLSYDVQDAIVGVRFSTGDQKAFDSANSVIVIDDPTIEVVPALKRSSTRGSATTEWSVMSSNARVGHLSVFAIPTSWTTASLDPTEPLASIALCDVALRVATFGKQSWGNAVKTGGVPTQSFGISDNGLSRAIDPATARTRPVWNGSSFEAAGVEHESFQLAVHVPKNTTHNAAAEHHVLSPIGNGARLSGARGSNGADVLGSSFTTYDPRAGVDTLACSPNVSPGDLSVERERTAAVCKAYLAARDAGDVLAELLPTSVTNGRFYGLFAVDDAAYERAGGRITFSIADGDDNGAFDAAGHWAKRNGSYVKRIPVSDFYDDAVPFTLAPQAGRVSVARDAKGDPMVRIDSYDFGGGTHRITSTL